MTEVAISNSGRELVSACPWFNYKKIIILTAHVLNNLANSHDFALVDVCCTNENKIMIVFMNA